MGIKLKNTNSKKWFDKNYLELKRATRKLGREKHNDPGNEFLREMFRNKIKEYKK